MWRFLFLVIAAVLAAFLAIAFASFRWFARKQLSGSKHRLALNRHNQRRLKTVLSELLAHANEIDQASKYVQPPVPAQWSRQLSMVCTRLVLLSETLELLQQQSDTRDPRSTQDDILRCCRLATHLSWELRALNQAVIPGEEAAPRLLSVDDVERH